MWLNLIPNLFILNHPLFCLGDIKRHCIGRVFIVLSHAITKYIFRCLVKQRYQCPINLIAHNITTALSIIAWHIIRDHRLVYIDRKYISYLPLSIKVFSCNLFLTKFQHLLLLITFLISAYQIILKQVFVTSTASSLLLTYTNPSNDRDARQ